MPGTGVRCILRDPGGLRGGLAIDHLVSQIDLFPTPVPLPPGAFTTSADERDPDGPRKHHG